MFGHLFGWGYGYGYGMGNYSYFLYVLPALLLSMWAQSHVKSTFGRYSGVMSLRGYTGAQAARMILDRNGLTGVQVEPIAGNLNDHYDPRANVIRLSSGVYNSGSVAAIGVAAHETGHAIQHSVGYAPLVIRNAIIPVTQFGSSISVWLVILGVVMSFRLLALAGIILFSVAVLFQVITLPVEYNASSRALRTLDETGMLADSELDGARRVLHAAALTYVAATLVAFANLLWLLSIFNNNRRRN